jgi:hypothetical protein
MRLTQLALARATHKLCLDYIIEHRATAHPCLKQLESECSDDASQNLIHSRACAKLHVATPPA